MDEKAERQHLGKILRWSGRILSIIITALGGLMLIGGMVNELLSQGFITASIEGGLLLLIGLIAVAGCILCWRRELLASILLVVTSAGLGVHIGFFAGRNHLLAWMMLGMPYLIAGLLMFTSWQLSGSKR